ncbi:MAG: FAD-dependent oxidoreductase [Chloroflexi bacterium]|nr:FAD-dependent oxidoreductase [Chloroflexota bacterium]
MKYEFDLAIIGAGSAGLLAAQVAPNLGLKAALIERHRLGGDCLWTGCVPSKALIASAKAAHTIQSAERFALPATEIEIDTAKIFARIRQKQEEIAAADDSPERFRESGVDVIIDEASIVDGHTVRAGERTLTARYILICTGSRPTAPPIPGLEEVGYLTNETLFRLERAPRSFIIVGAGPIGVEMAQALHRLGVKTTLLEQLERILVRDEPSLSDTLLAVLRDEGIDVQTGVSLERARPGEGGKQLEGQVGGEPRTWCAEEILVAAGRKANVEKLGLEQAGVEAGPKGIVVDDALRSTVPSIYAVGDAAGRFLFTHSAAAETSTVIRNMFYPGTRKAPELIPWATFTDPELAHVGVTSEEARQQHGEEGVRVFQWRFANNDRARVESATEGRMLVVTGSDFKILGAHILAPAASEMIGQFTLAMDQGVKLLPAFRDLIQIYPTFSTSFPQLTEDAAYEQLGKPLYRGLRQINERFGI